MPAEQQKQTILAVDDTPENLDVVKSILAAEYAVKAAINGMIALKIAEDHPPDLILLDIMMPEMDGYEVCKRLKGDGSARNIPIIFLSAKDQIEDEQKGFELGAVDYIQKPVSPLILKARVKTQLAIYDQNRVLETMVRERTRELVETRKEIIRTLGRAAEFKDNETGLHVVRMSHYARLLGLAIGMTKDEADLTMDAAQMHDVGKIGIPDAIILKNGKLNDEEWKAIIRHPEFGAEIIGVNNSELLSMAREVSLTHHEKWNGKGYPKGLKGEQIPLLGRITAIVDVFDALTSQRPYKKAWTVEKTIKIMKQEKGKHFDPELVEKFIEILPKILKIKEMYSETQANVVCGHLS